MRKGSILTILLAVAVLGIGLLLVFFTEDFVRKPKFHGKVADLLPKEGDIPLWTVSYQPIAETPEMKARVNELLNFDDAIFAIYTKPEIRISIYLAYWKPGRMPIKEIARHTPDVCWIEAGWQRKEFAYLNDLRLQDGREVTATEYRSFAASDHVEYVAFWHIAGEDSHSYRTGGRPSWRAVITDVLHRGVDQKPEQFFLRISSNQPIERFWGTDVIQDVLKKFPALAKN